MRHALKKLNIKKYYGNGNVMAKKERMRETWTTNRKIIQNCKLNLNDQNFTFSKKEHFTNRKFKSCPMFNVFSKKKNSCSSHLQVPLKINLYEKKNQN